MTEAITNKSPMVSVFMPAYNQEHLIAESIDSVINQTYDDWELVISDDCSSDRTYEIALEYQKLYPKKIKVFRNEKNLGITGNCNALLKKCTAKYIAFTAGDDLFLPEKLQKQVGAMESDNKSILCYHDVEAFEHGTNKIIKYWNHGPGGEKALFGTTVEIAKHLVSKGTGFMAALSVMVRRDALPRNGYDSRIPISSDWMMWIEVCVNNSGNVVFINEVLARYRKSSSSVSESSDKYEWERYVTLAIVEDKYPFLAKEIRIARGYSQYQRGVKFINGREYALGRMLLWDGAFCSIYSIKFIGWIALSFIKQILKVR